MAPKKLLALATAGAGGDLQPLLAMTAVLQHRGHDLVVFGSREVASALSGLGVETVVSRPELDLGPRLIAARDETTSLPVEDQGGAVGRRLVSWGGEMAAEVQRVVRHHRPDILLSSLFGALFTNVVAESNRLPWVAINSTFYFGTRSDRQLEDDFAPRTLILFRDFLLPRLRGATLVLHATDQHFDFDWQALPPRQHYVGPLLWELPQEPPAYLSESGPPPPRGGRDQPGVAARAERLGVAKVVRRHELSVESLRSAVGGVMTDPGYASRSGAEAKRLQAEDPARHAAELIEQL